MSLRANVQIAIDQAQLRALGAGPASPIFQFWLRTVAQVDAVSKQKLSGDVLNVRTGNLRSSQSFRVENQGDLIVGINENVASYALALHEGSAPHLIQARNSKFLTGWSYNNAPVFTRVVHHPGTKSKPWMRDALNEVMAAL